MESEITEETNIRRVAFEMNPSGSQIDTATQDGSSSDIQSISAETSSCDDNQDNFEIPVSISGIHAKELTDQESMQLSSSLRVKNKDSKLHVKELFYAGVAPSRLNLSKVSMGRYMTRFFRHHKWSSQRSKYLWQRIRVHVLRDKAPDDDDDDDDEEALYQTTLSQGFKLEKTFKRPTEITALTHNPKLPVHLLDGSLGYDFHEGDAVVATTRSFDENEDEEDFFSENETSGKIVSHTFIIIDSKKILSMYDSQNSEPTQTLKLEKDMSFLIFLPKYCLYAGLIEQRTIQFFTSKLDFTSTTKSPFPIESLLYEEKSNELIGIGTHKIIIWTLESSYFKGAVSLTCTIKMFLEPKTDSNRWISVCCLVNRMRQIWVVVDKIIHVYDLENGELVHYLKNVMSRRITCLASHDSNSYMLAGGIDGTVKVLNIINATVHEFFAHSRPIVSIAVIPRGPLFITVGQDNTLRLFNLKYFREICCIRLNERPIEMGMVGEGNIYIRTRSYTQLWATNQFNVNFATMSSNITHLKYVKSVGNKFSKIFARTADNVLRLLSPITGRTITANLPPTENEVVLDVAYYSQTDRMYVLLETGDIWVFRTDQNPFTVVDVWNSAEARLELCTKLLICQGKFSQEDAQLCPPKLTSFGFLFAGTKSGHILVIGRGGFVIDRYQLHMGEITEMNYQEEDHVLITSGLDTRIRISKIEPFHSNLIQIQIDIITNYIPQAIAILGNIICVAADDASIQMFETNIKKREWKIMKGHLKSHDHAERVTGIISSPENRVFLSIALDNSLRIWSDKNKFIREIYFQEPLSSLCSANEKGDVVIGVGNRIDIVKSSLYLPPFYFKNKKNFTKPEFEKPLLFDDSLVPFTRAPKISHRNRERLLVDKSNPFEIFCETNLQWFERASNIRRKPVYHMGADFDFETGGAEVDHFIRTIENQMRQRKLITRNQRRKSMGYDGSQETELLRKKAALLQLSQTTEEVAMLEQETEEKVLIDESEQYLTPAEKIDKQLAKSRLLYFIGDGFLPNSKGSKLKISSGWRKIKTGVHISAGMKRKKPKVVSANPESDLSKSKLHAKMKKMIEQEKIEELEAQESATIAALLESEENLNETTQKLRLGGTRKLNGSNLELGQRFRRMSVNEYVIPIALERIMNYDWFPEDVLFHPIEYKDPNYDETIVLTSKGRRLTRIPKIEGDPDDLLPVLIETFNNSNSKTRIEVLTFIKWLESDCGFVEKKEELANFFCEKVSATAIVDSEDIRNRIQMIEMTATLPGAEKYLFQTLFLHIKSPYNLIRLKSIQVLRSMGFTCIEEPFIQKTLDSIPKMVEEANSQFEISYGEKEEIRDRTLAGITKEFLQKALHKYLITSAQSIETSKILQIKNCFGKDDTARINAQITRRGKDKKSKKTHQKVVYSKKEEEIDIFERRLSIVDPVAFENNAKSLRENVVAMRTREFKSELNPKEYPKLPHLLAKSPEGEERNPLSILQNPALSDYIDALNFLYYEEEQRIAELERKREAELLAQKRAHELFLLEQRKRADEMNAQQKLIQERLAAENARKERLRLIRLARKNGLEGVADLQEHEEEKKKLKFSEMQTLGIGLTHHSHCHSSREVIDVRYKKKPSLLDSGDGYINTSLAMHFKTINRSMAMEKIQLHTVAFDNLPDASKEKKSVDSNRFMRRPKTSPTRGDRLEPPGLPQKISKPGFKTLDTNQEMEFIRGGTSSLPQADYVKRPQSSTSFLDYVQNYREKQQKQVELAESFYQSSSKRYVLPSQF